MHMDINRVVDKVYVLTIDRNSDRHQNVRSILENIDFDFWYGLDAKVHFPDKKYVSEIADDFFIKNNIDKEFASGSTIGQFGAYFSIKNMVDYVAQSGYEKVLIFEDDMLPLKKEWHNILKNAIEELPEDWDILLAGYLYDGSLYKYAHNRPMRLLIKFYNKAKVIFQKKNVIKSLPVKFSKHLDISGYSTGGHAYCLSKKGAQLLSSYLSPMRDSGDLLVSRLITEKKIKAFSVYPCLFFQDQQFASKTEVI